jgi:hypothetical protein
MKRIERAYADMNRQNIIFVSLLMILAVAIMAAGYATGAGEAGEFLRQTKAYHSCSPRLTSGLNWPPFSFAFRHQLSLNVMPLT